MAGVDKVLYLLKTRGEQTAQTLAELLQLTSMGARKHLEALQQRGLVCSEDRPAGKGRPARYWQLTDAGHARFPDRHGELTAQLLVLLRETAGEAAVGGLEYRPRTTGHGGVPRRHGRCGQPAGAATASGANAQ